jgi:proteasome assembly chaperone (PAC2) family protein
MTEPNADGLTWHARPTLRRPVFVAGFEGWNDAADAASDAASWLVRHGDLEPFASIDPEFHVDFQARRPRVELLDGVTRSVHWPRNEFYAVRRPEADHDLIVLVGCEPNYRWQSFCRAIVDVARAYECEYVFTFGALLADTPHSRGIRVTGTASNAALIERFNLQVSRYEGPTGIVGVLQDALQTAGLPAISLWAPVPHYIAQPPNPLAIRELLVRLNQLVDVRLDVSDLDTSIVAWRHGIDETISGDEDMTAYVQQLEERFDESIEPEPAFDAISMPSADDLADEVERFLREQGRES